MLEKFTLVLLKENSVSVERQQHIVQDDIEYPIGEPHFKSYRNTINGRQGVQNDLPYAQQNAIFAVWGDTPTEQDYAE